MSDTFSSSKQTKTQRFDIQTVRRSQITLADYNPRVIDAHARKRLKAKIETDGLVEPLIWNKRTGNLVGGHQRLQIVDDIEGHLDYTLAVAVVDLDERRERQLNVWLNNPAVQGQFDYDRLLTLFHDGETNPFESGFERLDLELMFPPDAVETMLAQFGGAEPSAARPAGLPGRVDTAKDAASVAEIKELRETWKKGNREDLRADHIAVVVFPNTTQASAFMRALGLDETQTFVDSERFISACEALDFPLGERMADAMEADAAEVEA